MDKSTRRLVLIAVGALAVLIAAAIVIWHSGLGQIFRERKALEDAVAALGAWGPVVIILAEIAQVILAAIPGNLVGVVAGYAYGILWGTLICLVGLTIGTGLAVYLGRKLGRPLVERFAGPELIERIDRYSAKRGAWAFFIIFLLPFLPDDIACFVAGLTPLPLIEMMVLAFIGRAPGVIVSCWIGAQSTQLGWPALVLIGLGSIVLAVLFERFHKQIEEAMFSLLDRLPGRKSD